MENVILIVHLLLALALIVSVLLQRSEGGGLGIGGGGGGTMSGRPPASPMAKFTWMLAIAFIITSLALTYYATQNASGASVIDRLGDGDGSLTPPPVSPALPPALGGGDLTPPSPTDGPIVPPSE
ncbi:MAG: preprotein translocase subunit SecG [Pseudomonadota bacterium]